MNDYRTHPDWLQLLAEIRSKPADDLPRLIVADWLDEHDAPERGELIRIQVRLAQIPKPVMVDARICEFCEHLKNGLIFRSAPIQPLLDLREGQTILIFGNIENPLLVRIKNITARDPLRSSHHHAYIEFECEYAPHWEHGEEHAALTKRNQELATLTQSIASSFSGLLFLEFERGFASEFRTSFFDWNRNVEKVIPESVGLKVVLTTRPEFEQWPTSQFDIVMFRHLIRDRSDHSVFVFGDTEKAIILEEALRIKWPEVAIWEIPPSEPEWMIGMSQALRNLEWPRYLQNFRLSDQTIRESRLLSDDHTDAVRMALMAAGVNDPPPVIAPPPSPGPTV